MRELLSTIGVCALLGAAACTGPDQNLDLPSDSVPVPDATGLSADPVEDRAVWPDTGAIDYRDERTIDLTRDGRNERVIAAARGPSYDSLDISITIEGESGDTLWREAWPSLLYFKYDPLEGKADTTVARIVRDHVELLIESDRFTMDGGLPDVLSRGGDPDALMREAIHYHLAELDYRSSAGIDPAAETPPDAHSNIATESVPAERVDAVLDELKNLPSFMYYAGGEATYVIAWSPQEESFVRIFACC